MSTTFSEHNSMKLNINGKRKTGKFTNVWRVNSTLLNNRSKKKSKWKIKRCLETDEKRNTTDQKLQYEQKQFKE